MFIFMTLSFFPHGGKGQEAGVVERRRGRVRREKIRGDGHGCQGFCVCWRGALKG